MKNPSRIFLLCLPFVASFAFADYQLEVNGGLDFTENEFETSGTLDTDTLKVSGKYYLKPISTINDDPLEELAFLQKASWGSIGLTNINQDSKSTAEDSTNAVFAGRYVLPDNHFFAETSFEIGDTDQISIGLGRYLDDKTTILGSYEVDGNTNTIDASFKRMISLTTTNTISLDASVGRIELNTDDSALLLGGEVQYYLDRKLSVGSRLGFTTGDVDSYAFGVTGKAFFTEQFAISASYSFIDREVEGQQDQEISSFDLALTGRF